MMTNTTQLDVNAALKTQVQARTLYQDNSLWIEYFPGTGPNACIAFTGAPMGDGTVPAREFVGLGVKGGKRHFFMVRDLNRSWFSADGLRDRVVSVLRKALADLKPAHVFTLGNSMGGHGALIFAAPLDVDAAIAFTPQYTMRRDLMQETRWDVFRPNMIEERLACVGDDWQEGRRTWVVAPANDHKDLEHVAKIRERTDCGVLITRAGPHNIARLLKRLGHLDHLVEALAYGGRIPMPIRQSLKFKHPLTRIPARFIAPARPPMTGATP